MAAMATRRSPRPLPTSRSRSYVYNVALDYGLCDADVTHFFNGYLNYDLPFGHGARSARPRSKVVNAILGDWRYDTIVTAAWRTSDFDDPVRQRSDRRLLPAASGLHRALEATPYKNFVGGGYVWFDPTTMAIPGPGKFGTCGISTERGPGMKQIDMSLSKRFNVTERQSLEFRFDAINASTRRSSP